MQDQISASSVIGSRLAALRFPPYFFGAVAVSCLGDLGALWMRLGEEDRRELEAFEQVFGRGHRHELRGEVAEAGDVYRELLARFPRFGALAQERIQALDLAVESTRPEVSDA